MRLLRALCGAVGLVVVPSIGRAYESDQLMARLHPPRDISEEADEHANLMLGRAALRANALGACKVDEARAKELVAAQVHREMGGKALVRAPGAQPMMSFGAYAAWLERAPLPKASWGDRADLYGSVPLRDNLLLKVVGPSSTVQLAGVLVGTDKIDHFWVQGFDYYQRSGGGQDPERALDWGTGTEWGVWGVRSTGVFSFSDLAANHAGYRFYTHLLGPTSPLQRGANGCVGLSRPFRWQDWIDWRLDEVLNPSVYEESLAEDIRRVTIADGQGLCAGGRPLLGPDERALLRQALTEVPAYAGAAAPRRDRALDLTDLCPALREVVGELIPRVNGS
ncbi:MAG: hypothetical protein RL071_1771 [Pseudomonadota bacterium]